MGHVNHGMRLGILMLRVGSPLITRGALIMALLTLGAGDAWAVLGFGPPEILNTTGISENGVDWDPDLVTDGLGHWLAVWHSREILGGTVGTDTDIFISRSLDNGSTWASPETLNSNAAGELRNDEFPQVATDGAGHWVAVWSSIEDLGGTVGLDWDIFVSRSTDNGLTWSTMATLNTNAGTDLGDDEFPRVMTDGLGHWVAVWVSTEDLGGTIGTDQDIFVSHSSDNGFTWSAPAILNTNADSDTGSDVFPQLVTDGSGHWGTAWWSDEDLGGTAGVDYDIFFARSADNGASWSAPTTLNTNADTDTGGDQWPHLSTEGSGNWTALWSSNEELGGTLGWDGDILIARSMDSGATWSSPEAFNTNADSDSGYDTAPQMIANGPSSWVAVWYSTENLGGTVGTDAEIFFSRSTDSGATWASPEVLNTNADSDSEGDYDPMIATDGAGHWITVWHSQENLDDRAGDDRDIFFSRSLDDGVSWSAVATLSAHFDSECRSDLAPQVTTDGLGHWVAVWVSMDSDSLVCVSRSNDNGVTWTTPDPLNASLGSWGYDNDPQVTADGLGHWVAVWHSMKNPGGLVGADYDIFFAHSTDNGETWSYPDLLNTNAFTDSERDWYPQLATDGLGHWVAVWQSREALGGTAGTDFDIFVSRSADSGASWTAPATLNINADSDVADDWSPQLATDASGNWIAVWQSTENLGGAIGTDFDIFVSRSSDSGVNWTMPEALSTNAATDTGMDGSPTLATDGLGTWVAVWRFMESMGSDVDLLVSNSTDSGVTWSVPQFLNANAGWDTGDDNGCQVSTDGLGNWVAIWCSDEDLGSADTDNDIFISLSTDGGATWSFPTTLNTTADTDTGQDLLPQITADSLGHWVAVWYSEENIEGLAGTDWDIFVSTSGTVPVELSVFGMN
jgi:BNR repeat-like domain